MIVRARTRSISRASKRDSAGVAGIGALGSDGVVGLPPLTHLRASDRVATRWKNGGGTTTEICSSPPGATLYGFDWRISIAQVETDGPFSLFPDVQRTLAVIGGEGLQLTISGATDATLSAGSEPLSFAGDVPVFARLLAGPVTDLNVMSRRSAFAATLQRFTAARSLLVDANTDCVLVAVGGAVDVEVIGAAERTTLTLAGEDACSIDAGVSYGVCLHADDNASCYAALVRRVPISTGADSPPPLPPHPTAR